MYNITLTIFLLFFLTFFLLKCHLLLGPQNLLPEFEASSTKVVVPAEPVFGVPSTAKAIVPTELVSEVMTFLLSLVK